MPVIIGAAIGSFSGYQIGKAHGAQGFWEWAGYVGGGALIGGAAGGAAWAVGTAVGGAGGAMLAGATGGAINGGGFSGLAGGSVIDGAWKGAMAGFAGGAVGSLIGGGTGAFFGGATGAGVNTALHGGSGKDILKSSLIGGGIGLGMYHTTNYINYKRAPFRGLSYRQYNRMLVDQQRTVLDGRERGAWFKDNGGVVRWKPGEANSLEIPAENIPPKPDNASYAFHTHHDRLVINDFSSFKMGDLGIPVEHHSPADIAFFNHPDNQVPNMVIDWNSNMWFHNPGTTISYPMSTTIPYPSIWYMFYFGAYY